MRASVRKLRSIWGIVGYLALIPACSSSAIGQTVTNPITRRVPEIDGDSGPTVSLVQISITIPQNWPAAAKSERKETFISVLPVIRSCDDIDAVANAFGGEVVRNDTLHMSDLPVTLRDDLNERAIGTASIPFGDGDRVSVLVRCD